MNTKSIVLSLVLALGTGAAFAAPAGEAFDYPGAPGGKATATATAGTQAGPAVVAGEAFDYPAAPATRLARDARPDAPRAKASRADRVAVRADGPYYLN